VTTKSAGTEEAAIAHMTAPAPVVVRERVVSRDGKHIGMTTGSWHLCQMEGCGGRRLSVKWGDGKNTRPCTKGMDWHPRKGWRIL
jgi:hypothetical protein